MGLGAHFKGSLGFNHSADGGEKLGVGVQHKALFVFSLAALLGYIHLPYRLGSCFHLQRQLNHFLRFPHCKIVTLYAIANPAT